MGKNSRGTNRRRTNRRRTNRRRTNRRRTKRRRTKRRRTIKGKMFKCEYCGHFKCNMGTTCDNCLKLAEAYSGEIGDSIPESSTPPLTPGVLGELLYQKSLVLRNRSDMDRNIKRLEALLEELEGEARVTLESQIEALKQSRDRLN